MEKWTRTTSKEREIMSSMVQFNEIVDYMQQLSDEYGVEIYDKLMKLRQMTLDYAETIIREIVEEEVKE